MQTPTRVFSRIGRPLLGAGALSLALLLSACGGDDGPGNPGNGDNGGQPGGDTPPAACATAHCAPTP